MLKNKNDRSHNKKRKDKNAKVYYNAKTYYFTIVGNKKKEEKNH